MKLKQIVGSMILLGVATSPALAATNNDTQGQLDAMKAQIAKLEVAMNGNNPGGFAAGANDGWFNRIALSGQANLDSAYATRSPVMFNKTGGSVNNIAITNANLYMDAQVSDWTAAHVGLMYAQDNTSFVPRKAGDVDVRSSSNVFDEAYVTIANLAKSPFYLKAGLQRVDFGDYSPYADITPSTTQLLSETKATAATVGFVSGNGFNASAYTFRGIDKAGASATLNGLNRTQNFGLHLGFTNSFDNFGYKVGADYIHNMADIGYLGNGLSTAGGDTVLFTDKVAGLALNASGSVNAFDASAKYVTALQKFNANDVAYVKGGTTQGAKPVAWSVAAGYSFPVMGHTSRFGLGYQGTNQAADVGVNGMPKTRYMADYTVNVSKFTDLGFEIRNDRAYATDHDGNGNNATTGTVRLAVKFA